MKNLDYEIVKTKRRTMSIVIDRAGKVTVRAPLGLNEGRIREFVKLKSQWILKKLGEIESRKQEADPGKKFTDGEQFDLMGEKLTLTIMRINGSDRIEAGRTGNMLKVSLPAGLGYDREFPVIRKIISDWYRNYAKDLFIRKVIHFSEKMGVNPSGVKVRDQKTRWGSCSSKGSLNFSWRIIMAPEHVVDYLVVHELAHLKELNHSKNFWGLVETVLPEYKSSDLWLKNHGENLRCF